jgi:hypothetical protein
MHRARRAIWLAASLAAALLGGCGKPAPSAAPKDEGTRPPEKLAVAAPRACDILSADLAKKYLGDAAVLRRDAQPNPRMTQCQWGSDKGVITIMVGPWDMVHTASPNAKPVSGLGDEAYSDFSGLEVRKGDRGVSINVMVEAGEFWGKAAEDEEAKTPDAEARVAPDLVAKL